MEIDPEVAQAIMAKVRADEAARVEYKAEFGRERKAQRRRDRQAARLAAWERDREWREAWEEIVATRKAHAKAAREGRILPTAEGQAAYERREVERRVRAQMLRERSWEEVEAARIVDDKAREEERRLERLAGVVPKWARSENQRLAGQAKRALESMPANDRHARWTATIEALAAIATDRGETPARRRIAQDALAAEFRGSFGITSHTWARVPMIDGEIAEGISTRQYEGGQS